MELEKSSFKGFGSLFSVQKDGSRTKAEAFDSTLNQQFALQDDINATQKDHRSRPNDDKAGEKAEVSSGDTDQATTPQDERKKEVAEALGVDVTVVETLAQEYPLLAQFIETGEVPQIVDGETPVDGMLSPAALLALGAQVEEQLTASGQFNRVDLRKAADQVLQSLQAAFDGDVPEDVVEFLQQNFGPLSAEVVDEIARGQTVSRPNAALLQQAPAGAVQQVADELVAFIDDGGRAASNLADIRAAAERIVQQVAQAGSSNSQAGADDGLGQQLAQGSPDQNAAAAAAAAQQAVARQAAAQAAARGAAGFQQVVSEAGQSGSPSATNATTGGAAQQAQQGEQTQSKQSAQQAAARQAPQQPVHDQVAIQIRRAVSTGQDRIQIRLNPVDLGRIEVEMTMAQDGQLQAVIKAEKPDTLDLLMRDARHLERALADAGLKLDNSALQFQLAGGNANGGQQQNGGNGEMSAFVGNEVFDDEIMSADAMLGIDRDGFEYDEDGQHVSIMA